MLSKIRIAVRIHLMTLLALAALVTQAAMGTYETVTLQEQDRIAVLRHVVESAVSIAGGLQKQVAAGAMSEAQARAEAIRAIRAIRYRGEEYVWINDAGRIVMHPIKPELEGKAIQAVADPNGVSPFVLASEVAHRTGGGMFGYLWPRPGSAEPIEKLSFAQLFAPWDWVIASGVYVDDLRAAQRATAMRSAGVTLAAAVLVGLLGFLIARGVVRPLAALSGATGRVADGELETAIPGAGRGDELGILARALEMLRKAALHRRALEAEAAAERARKDVRQAARERHTDDFASSIAGVMTSLAHSSVTMRETAQSVAADAGATSEASALSLAGASEATQSLATVAAATEELSSSVNEISRQVAQAAVATGSAVARAAQTNASIASLSEAAGRITEVVRLIAEIAERTNLLALNATIEAARAGEAGRGFAVVASEVKQLAQQTARATTDIEKHVQTIQSATTETVAAVETVGESIGEVNVIAGAIAAAVEQQGAATAEIAQKVQTVAMQNSEETERLARLAEIATNSQRSGETVLRAAGGIVDVSTTLNAEVELFLAAMRADDGERRAFERVSADGRPARLEVAGLGTFQAGVIDISFGGVGLAVDGVGAAMPGCSVSVQFAGQNAVAHGRVVRQMREGIGVVFRGDAETADVVGRVLEEVRGRAA